MMDRIQVAADRWNFEEAATGKRFVPFGTNFVFDFADNGDKNHMMRSLNIVTDPVWRPIEIQKAFLCAKELHFNVMKVFLPLPEMLPDPQPAVGVRFCELTPSIWERLDYLFLLAEETGVYLSLALAEWGVHSLKWFWDGGGFFGAHKDGETDSYRILAEFWKELARFCKDKNALFSYNLSVEFYLPSDNWGGIKPGTTMFSDELGVPAFHAWLKYRYPSVSELNARYHTDYSSFDEVVLPDCLSWNPYLETYNVSREFLEDYNDFRECVNYFFFKNQCDAIRSIDSSHMITAGLHPDQIGMAPKGNGWKIAGINNKEYDIFDYVTIHLYTNLAYLIERPLLPQTFSGIVAAFQTDRAEIARRRKECQLYCRFIHRDRPIMVEEFGHASYDMEESYAETVKLVEELAGHVSGFMLWQFGSSYQDMQDSSCPMTEDFELNSWGKRWKTLAEGNGIIAQYPKQRIPARTVVKLNRAEASAPIEETAGEKIMHNWNAYLQPVDFELPDNPTLAYMKQTGMTNCW